MNKLIPTLAAVVLLAGCAGAPTPTRTISCDPVSDDLAAGLFDEEYGFDVSKAAAIRNTESSKELWYVAAAATDGDNDVVGIWAASNIEGGQGALVWSVDGIAKEFSSWPDAKEIGLSLTDAGARDAKLCVTK